MSYSFPPSFVVAESNLTDVFFDEAASLGISHSEAERLLKVIPASVRSAKAMKFVFGEDWRYIYGKQFHFGDNSRGFGIPYQAPLVVNLIRAIVVADRVLNVSQFRHWRQQLDIQGKHLDAIVEMLSVFDVAPNYQLAYEQVGLGVGLQKIDWLLKTKDEGEFLLEVKNRPGQMVQEMARIKEKSIPIQSDPIPGFSTLFKSATSKFLTVNDSIYTQGVILFLGLKVPATALDTFFRNYLLSHLHFIALGKEEKETGIRVNLVASSLKVADRVRSVFKWNEGADLIC